MDSSKVASKAASKAASTEKTRILEMPNHEGDSIQVSVSEPRVRIKEVVTIWILFFINLFNYIDRYIVSGYN